MFIILTTFTVSAVIVFRIRFHTGSWWIPQILMRADVEIYNRPSIVVQTKQNGNELRLNPCRVHKA